VLEVLDINPHVDASLIYEKVKTKIATASKQAIYNNLSTLVEHGIVREIKPKGSVSLYETRTGDNHHHIVCESCKVVVDTGCKDGAPCLVPSDDHGFELDEAEIIFWGTCPACQKLKAKRRK
jgi:Fur family ferric uptake transcriptional regulator